MMYKGFGRNKNLLSVEPYLSDNPFRILGIGSDTNFLDVKILADGYFQKKRANLTNLPLPELLGLDTVVDLRDYVRKLATDQSQLLTFRLFWPQSKDLVQVLEPNDSQTSFPICWLRFLRSKEPEDLILALEVWHKQKSDDNYLSTLSRDWKNEPIGKEEMQKGFQNGCYTIVGKAIGLAKESLDLDDLDRAMLITETLLKSSLFHDESEWILSQVESFGDHLASKVKTINRTLESSDPRNLTIATPTEVEHLEKLVDILSQQHPACERLSEISNNWYYWAARKLYDRAIFTEPRQAIELLYQARMVGKDTEFAAKIEEKIAEFVSKIDAEIDAKMSERSDSMAKATPKPKEAKSTPIDVQAGWELGNLDIPRKKSIFGTGTQIYKRQRYHRNSSLSYAILYVTAFYFPVFPLARFVVQDIGTGKFIYFERTKWSVEMKAHAVIAVISGLTLVFYWGWVSSSLLRK